MHANVRSWVDLVFNGPTAVHHSNIIPIPKAFVILYHSFNYSFIYVISTVTSFEPRCTSFGVWRQPANRTVKPANRSRLSSPPPGSTVWRFHGFTAEPWNRGTVKPNRGTVEPWNRTVEPWNRGTEPWNRGTVKPRTVEPWNRTVEPWNRGTVKPNRGTVEP